ncbi:peptide ligase PGM1-related protein [Streptomyces sp. NPDC087850]|uniref:peptide ligase PGM1-related protein n=1 Tax=Streptomyces sp. NPDC087850 TaxID=3365809 RepID=UPI003819C3C0
MPSSLSAAQRKGTLTVSVQSRECSTLLLENLPGSTLFPERPVGAAIINALRRPGDSVLCVTAPRMRDAEAQIAYFSDLAVSVSTVSAAAGPAADADTADRKARDRVEVLSLDDSSPRWLSEKLLDAERPEARAARKRLTEAVAAARAAGDGIRLSYFEPSENLESLAEELGVPADQAPARCIPLGTKAAGRALFQEAGIAVAPGTTERFDLDGLVDGVCALLAGGSTRLVLKLSSTAYGAGLGNAIVDLVDLADAAAEADTEAGEKGRLAGLVRDRLADSQVLDSSLGWEGFRAAIPEAGVVAEELLTGDELRSPSYQGRIRDGAVVTVSTHEQVLGPNGQTYTGSAFPAADAYRSLLIEYGRRIGSALIRRGVGQGDYGVDFVTVRRGEEWQVYGIELNLRATGTLHAFGAVTGLLGVVPDGDGVLYGPDGTRRTYLASDSITSPAYRGLMPAGLIELVRDSPLHWDPGQGRGVVLHMLSALPDYGKFGAVCVGADQAEAAELMSRLRALADGWAASMSARSTGADSVTVPSGG